jgi:hypothetical protein
VTFDLEQFARAPRVCGILQTAAHQGYANSYVSKCDRQLPGRRYSTRITRLDGGRGCQSA